MDEPTSPKPTALEPYEPPAILWEQQLVALAACSPPCTGGEICVGDICIPPGG